jgi:hypothetical protein
MLWLVDLRRMTNETKEKITTGNVINRQSKRVDQRIC